MGCGFTKSKSIILILVVLVIGLMLPGSFAADSDIKNVSDYNPERLIVKFKDMDELNIVGEQKYKQATLYNVKVKSNNLNKIFQDRNVKSIKSLFPPGSKLKKLENKVFTIESDSQSLPLLLDDLKVNPQVEYAEYDYKVEALFTPNDPLFSQQWALNNIGQTGGTNDSDIDAPEAWDITKGASNVIIAVIDTGINYTHSDLGGCIGAGCKIVGGYDFVNHDSNPIDDHGHGTHVAGIIAASTNNSKGVSGVCPNCRLMSLKFLNQYGSGYTSDAVLAVDYAVSNGAKILSNSWGSDFYSQSLQDSINAATANGVLFIASAGNSNTEEFLYPASMDNVLSVAATDNMDKKSSYSTYGTWVDISAPGGDINKTSACRYPSSISILSTVESGDIWRFYGTPCKVIDQGDPSSMYIGLAGTSMAAPQVSGVAGLLLSVHSNWTPSMLSGQLKFSADNIDSKNPAYVGKLGTGRVNAYRALTLVGKPEFSSKPPVVKVTGHVYKNIYFEPGETANLFINLTNELDYAYSVQGVLSTTDSNVTILKNTTQYGNFSGNEKQNNPPFSIKLASSAKSDHTINFKLNLTYQDSAKKNYSKIMNISYTTDFEAGWPTRKMNGRQVESILFYDLTGDGKKEIIATFSGGYETGVYIDSIIKVYNTGGYLLWQYGDKLNPFSQDALEPFSQGAIAIGDVDGDRKPEIVVGTRFADTGTSLDNGTELYVFEDNGTLKQNWPISVDKYTKTGSINLVDLNADGVLDIVAGFSLPNYIGWNTNLTAELRAYNGNGTMLWRRIAPKNYFETTSSSIAVLNVDGKPEIIYDIRGENRTTLKKMPTKILISKHDGSDYGVEFTLAENELIGNLFMMRHESGGRILSGDVNGDGSLEIIFTTYAPGVTGKLYVYRSDGTPLPGWPQNFTGQGDINPVSAMLSDIDNDGKLEIFVNSAYKLHGYYSNGSTIKGWPVTVVNDTSSRSPQWFGRAMAVVDVTSDNKAEILATRNCELFAYMFNGSVINGYPKRFANSAVSNCTWWLHVTELRAVTAGNLGTSNRLHIALGGYNDYVSSPMDYPTSDDWVSRIFLYDAGAFFYTPEQMQWPTFVHDERATANYNSQRCILGTG